MKRLSLQWRITPMSVLLLVVDGVQGRFRTTNWYITAAITLLSGILAYFVSGRALKPLRSFTSQVEQVQLNNLADMRIDEDAISEFRQLSRSFNQMLERLNNAFAAQRQFTGNAAHKLRTPLALMQAQLGFSPRSILMYDRRRQSFSRFCASRRSGWHR